MISFLCAFVAVAVSCDNLIGLEADWNTPEKRHVCEGLGYHECLSAIEAEAIRRRGGDVQRRGTSLVFDVGGEKFVLSDITDAAAPNDSQIVYYDYWGWSEEFHLLRLQFYEGYWYALLHAETTRITRIKAGGTPILSPDGKWAVSVGSQTVPHHTSSVNLWMRDKDGFQLVERTKFRAPTEGEARARWVSSEAIQVCPSGDASAPLGHLRFNDGVWKQEVNDDAVMSN